MLLINKDVFVRTRSANTKPVFTYSKSTMRTPEQCAKSVQSVSIVDFKQAHIIRSDDIQDGFLGISYKLNDVVLVSLL